MVVDASVALKWPVVEAGSVTAMALLRFINAAGESYYAPDIINVEVAAALTRLHREQKRDDHDVAEKLLQWRWFASNKTIIAYPVRHDFDTAIALSMRCQHQLQDCLYLAMAQRLQRPLLTADVIMAHHAVALGIDCQLITKGQP